MDDKSFIRFQNVSKWFRNKAGRFDALKSINFDINKGEYLAIVGKSGSGKSTLLNMLTGIDHPSEGSVMINSVNLHTLNESGLARWRGRNVGIVFQFFQLIPTLTVEENLLIAIDFVGVIPDKEKKQRVFQLLQLVGIPEQKDKLPSALSGGQQQRAAIARALVNDPPVIVADEPTGNLDSKTSRAVQGIFRALVDQGKTVVVVTHENTSGFDYDRVLLMQDGQLLPGVSRGGV